MSHEDQIIAHTKDGRALYDNAVTVVAVALCFEGRVVAIRRNTDPGKGKLALPGGFQMRGESWQEAGKREVLEEIGIDISSNKLTLVSFETDEYGHNVAIGQVDIDEFNPIINKQEVQEIVFIDNDNLYSNWTDWAFEIHLRAVDDIIYESWA